MAWEHGNLKTDTNTYYNITLFLSANYRKKLLVSRRISDDIKQFWKEHTFWTDRYFACSVGNVSEEMLKRYIENQG